MENNITSQSLLLRERTEKLKVFAILAIHKGIDDDITKNISEQKLVIAVSFAYSAAEAVAGAGQWLSNNGLDPELYVIPKMIVDRVVDEVVDMQYAPVRAVPGPVVDLAQEVAETKIIQEKSKQDMAAYVRFIFDKVGTPEEKEMAEAVISKFESSELVHSP